MNFKSVLYCALSTATLTIGASALGAITPPSPLGAATLTSPAASRLGRNLSPILKNQDADVTWDGQGDLPNGFKRPWTFADTDFDPSFRTSYWSERTGMLNVASAPWNQGMASHYGAQIYGYGMKYLGSYDYSPLLPVFAPLDTGTAL